MHQVIFGLGANVGDPLRQLAEAVRRLGAVTTVEAVSAVYRSAPMGHLDQPDFLNLVVVARSAEPPAALLAHALRIEAELGRVRTFRNAPRTIDIDLLDWGGGAVRTPDLTLPHPRMRERAFVLAPLAEVAPGWRERETGLSAAELLGRLPEPGAVERMGELEC